MPNYQQEIIDLLNQSKRTTMKKMFIMLSAWMLLSCGNNKADTKNEKIDSLTQKVNELTAKENEREQQKKLEAEKLKEAEIQGNKDLIIEQIKMGEGLVTSHKEDPISPGGINNGHVTIENALSGIVFQIVNLEVNVYLANGQLYKTTPYTFTNLKPGDVRTRDIPNTGTRGTKVDIVVTEIQSKWLTNGKLVQL